MSISNSMFCTVLGIKLRIKLFWIHIVRKCYFIYFSKLVSGYLYLNWGYCYLSHVEKRTIADDVINCCVPNQLLKLCHIWNKVYSSRHPLEFLDLSSGCPLLVSCKLIQRELIDSIVIYIRFITPNCEVARVEEGEYYSVLCYA